MCGHREFSVDQLKSYTIYDGYKRDDRTIRYFWEWLYKVGSCPRPTASGEQASKDDQRRFLRFVTGSDRVPVHGMNETRLKITRMTAAQNNGDEAADSSDESLGRTTTL